MIIRPEYYSFASQIFAPLGKAQTSLALLSLVAKILHCLLFISPRTPPLCSSPCKGDIFAQLLVLRVIFVLLYRC